MQIYVYTYICLGIVKGVRYKCNKIIHKGVMKQILKAMHSCTLNCEFFKSPNVRVIITFSIDSEVQWLSVLKQSVLILWTHSFHVENIRF